MLINRRVATAAQCRAARALLDWTQTTLAQRAGVARKTVADFELSRRTLHRRTIIDITAALEAAGVEFMWADGAANGEGVRFAREPAPLGTSFGAAAGETLHR
jgi:DNA-binding XRE family transcriptional regulator